MASSYFALVFPLIFWQIFMLSKALGRGHYQNQPYTQLCLVHPYFGNVFDLGIYPTPDNLLIWAKLYYIY
jgi:hypothetical protein